MNTHFLIEAFGYLGSFLVLVSMLMTSVVKLRIINTVGSVIFTIYAFIIKSYPTALMNFCLVLINLHFLWKMSRIEKEYEVVECDRNDVLLNYLLDHYRSDIEKIFPGVGIDDKQIDRAYVVVNQGKPVGFTLTDAQGEEMELKLDYSIPAYRDFSIGTALFAYLKQRGIARVIYKGPDENHTAYLNNQGFVKKDGAYIKEL
ncbi:MAG: YgjV family protein [Erysipelotrichaceae bacterium]|nr:YgjV family protein [Erysipelotrichaceae bacterium]